MNRSNYSNRAIPRAFLGYDRTRVDRLMQDMSDALAKVTEEKIALSTRLRNAEARAAEMKDRETAIQDAFAAAQRMGDDIRATAQKEAQLILETARLRAESILQNAGVRLARVMEEAAEAKKSQALFEMKLRATIDDHLRLLNLNRQTSAGLEAATRKLGGNNAMPPADEREEEKSGA